MGGLVAGPLMRLDGQSLVALDPNLSMSQQGYIGAKIVNLYLEVLYEIPIFVKTLTGKTITIKCRSRSISIAEFKTLVQQIEGIPPDQQRFILGGRQLEDCRSLASYKLTDYDMLHLVLRMRGNGDMLSSHVAQYTIGGLVFKSPFDRSEPTIDDMKATISITLDYPIATDTHLTAESDSSLLAASNFSEIAIVVQVIRGEYLEGSITRDAATKTVYFTPSTGYTYDTFYEISTRCVSHNIGFYAKFNTTAVRILPTLRVIRESVGLTVTLPASSYVVPDALAFLLTQCATAFSLDSPAGIESINLLLPNSSLMALQDSESIYSLRETDPLVLLVYGDSMYPQPGSRLGRVRSDTFPGCPLLPRHDMVVHDLVFASNSLSVHKGVYKIAPAAIKIYRTAIDSAAFDALEAETRLLMALAHPRIVAVIGVCKDLRPAEGTVALAMEWMACGSLTDVLHDTGS